MKFILPLFISLLTFNAFGVEKGTYLKCRQNKHSTLFSIETTTASIGSNFTKLITEDKTTSLYVQAAGGEMLELEKSYTEFSVTNWISSIDEYHGLDAVEISGRVSPSDYNHQTGAITEYFINFEYRWIAVSGEKQDQVRILAGTELQQVVSTDKLIGEQFEVTLFNPEYILMQRFGERKPKQDYLDQTTMDKKITITCMLIEEK